ncbi:MAG: hypothetical protein RL705_334 [Bacteroidota bacterium]|jgi:hypothetical protein
MSKILITGNGFDLFHHLPTKYGHFMAIMRTIEKKDFGEEITFEDLFGDYFKNEYHSDYKSIIISYNIEEIRFDKIQINELKDKLKTNNWYNYFKSALEIETWIDFENEINIALSEVIEILTSEGIFAVADLIENCQKHSLLKSFNIFLIDSSANLSYHKVKKSKNGVEKNDRVNEKKLFVDLSKSLDDFIIIFNRFLNDVTCVFYKYPNLKLEIPFHLVNKFYTFNYTPTLEVFYKVEKSKIVYLHGKINNNDDIQNLVLGVNDIPNNLKEYNLFDFEKTFQKIIKNTNHIFIDTSEKGKYQTSETIFYLIGHSLDKSDKNYIDDLFKYLETDKTEESKICLFYHNIDDRDNKLRNLYGIIGKNIIEKRNMEKRLYFVKLNNENLISELNRSFYNRGSEFVISI